MDGFAQLFEASVQTVNLPYTLLLGFVLLYWLTVILGMLDLSSLDFDLGELDSPDGVDAADLSTAGAFDGLLEYFNLRKVPLSIFASFMALSMWMIGIPVNEALHNSAYLLPGLAVFIGNLLISAHIAKYLCIPLVPLFANMRSYVSDRRDLIGSRVIVTSTTVDDTFGQAEIEEEGSPISLLVRCEPGEVLQRGDEAVILQKEPEKDIYLITKLEMEI